MPTYSWFCPECGRTETHTMGIDNYSLLVASGSLPPICNEPHHAAYNPNIPMKRIYEVPSIKPIMHEHLNPATGTVVSSATQHADDLKRASEAASIRTGMEHRFVPHDNRDPDVVKMLGVTDAGLESTRRARRAKGLDPGPTIL